MTNKDLVNQKHTVSERLNTVMRIIIVSLQFKGKKSVSPFMGFSKFFNAKQYGLYFEIQFQTLYTTHN